MLSELADDSIRRFAIVLPRPPMVPESTSGRLSQEGPEALLNQTEFTQPALLAAGVAVWRVWQAAAWKHAGALALGRAQSGRVRRAGRGWGA
jgi:malonyl CoA-acyl carrier protein transacylase